MHGGRIRRFVVLFALATTVSLAQARPRHHHHRTRSSTAAATSAHARHADDARRAARRGQSVGVPWDGHLAHASRLPAGDGYKIRRPWRAYGTRAAVDFVTRVARTFHARFPDAHVLAIGDLSAEHGGRITQHRSHQSGRDADIGLIYKHKPTSYPRDFVSASAANLDCAKTYAIVSAFGRTARRDGGAQIMFLDFDVQGLLYHWARAHGVSEQSLARLFQYPHGRGARAGLVRHEPNHRNHLHVRFKCPDRDTACR